MYDYDENLIKVKGKIHWFDILTIIVMSGTGYLIFFNMQDDFAVKYRLIGSILIFIIPLGAILLSKLIQVRDSDLIKYMKKEEIDSLTAEGKYLGAVFEDDLIRFTGFVRIESRNGTRYKVESFTEVLIHYSEIREIYINKEQIKIYYEKDKIMYNFNVSYYFNNSLNLVNEIKNRTTGSNYKIRFNF